MSKVHAHQRYRLQDGTQVPGVTTVLGILAKPALVKWANNLGLQGIDSSKYVDAAADIGTCAHYLIECSITGAEPDLAEYSPATVSQAQNSYGKWQEWAAGHTFDSTESELQLVHEEYRYGGTVDVYTKLDGTWTILDVKTSGSGIWPEMKHQVAAYAALLEANGRPVERAMIVRVSRGEHDGVETAEVTSREKHLEVFKHCLALYRLQSELKAG